jgi:hypothetical protein
MSNTPKPASLPRAAYAAMFGLCPIPSRITLPPPNFTSSP